MLNYTFMQVLILALVLTANATATVLLPDGIQTPQAKPSPAATLYSEGMQALLRKDLQSAEKAFQDCMNLDTRSPLPAIGLADVALDRQQPKEAKEWLDKALKIAPKSPLVHHAFGRFYYYNREYDKAERALQEVLRLDSKNFLAQIDLGDVYMNGLQRPAQAVIAYRAAVSINPNHAGAHQGLGIALAASSQRDEAERELRTAGKLAPNNPLPWLALGRLYLAQSKTDDALEAYDFALKIQANLMPALIGRGDALLGANNFNGAVEEFARVTKQTPNNAEAQLKLGMAYQALKNWPAAEKAYLAALQINPNLPLANNNLAWIYAVNKGDSPQALIFARKAVNLEPNTAVFQDTLGWVLRSQGKLAESESILLKASQMKPESAETYFHLGKVYLDQNNKKGAETAFRKALSIQKNYEPALQALHDIGVSP